MRRYIKYVLIGIVALVVLGAAGVWIFITSGLPLEDGAAIADGAVTVVTVDAAMMKVAAYLFRLEDGGFGLIDATLDPEAAAIRAALTRLGKTPEDVRAILFTHGHGDHTRGARAFPMAEVYGLDPDDEPVTRRVSDGEVLDLDGTRVEVFALPGHTADSAAYLVHGVLFFGDSAVASSNGMLAPAIRIFSMDPALNRQSLQELAERLRGRRSEIRYLAFGHQGPLEGLDPLLEWSGQQ